MRQITETAIKYIEDTLAARIIQGIFLKQRVYDTSINRGSAVQLLKYTSSILNVSLNLKNRTKRYENQKIKRHML